jgi:hypothetical protein
MLVVSAKPRLENRPVEARAPTRLSSFVFRLKAGVFQIGRTAANLASGPRRLSLGQPAAFPHLLARSRTPLWSDSRVPEQRMQRGKVENLRIAARALDRTVLSSGAVFSFWTQLGKPARGRGFVPGRMLQQGCVVPAIGGGLCQLSNALYDVALKAQCEIIERHAHSRLVPGSAASQGRDATVAWNYVDLRFRSARPLLLRVRLSTEALDVSLFAASADDVRAMSDEENSERQDLSETCGTCNEVSCFRHERATHVLHGCTAYLVSEAWPEFTAYVAQERQPGDTLCIPIDGARWGASRYAWRTDGFGNVVTATVIALRNSVAARRMSAQGALRRLAELETAEKLARRFARRLKSDVTELCVAQSLLPYLWRDGHLGGRRFRVLMTALPIGELQSRLDAQASHHPDRSTLSDYRASAELAELEADALAAAETIITPHAEIAQLFGARACRLAWQRPARKAAKTTPYRQYGIAFPGPTVARKGCYEMREAARKLDLEVVPLGSELEGAKFWTGVRVVQADESDWLNGVRLVVQPAIVEQAPRRLLAALAAGVPVMATAACGLEPQPGLTIVPAGDSEALAAAIARQLD